MKDWVKNGKKELVPETDNFVIKKTFCSKFESLVKPEIK